MEVKTIIQQGLIKRGMLQYVQDLKAVRGMGRRHLDHNDVPCKVRLVSGWIKGREEVDGARGSRSEKLREH